MNHNNYEYKPILYFAITFFVTFTLWFAGAYVSFLEAYRQLYMLLMLPGLMAPFLISMAMVFMSGNSEIKKDYVSRLINFKRIQPKTLPVFILLMPLSVLTSIFISFLFGEPASQLQLAGGFSFSGFVPVLMLLMLAAVFEELGWRGYAFDSLQSRYSLFTASIIFSVLWSLWHFPLIFVNDSYQYKIFHENIWFAVNFFVSIIPMGVIITWICIKNGKSIIAAIIFHFIINMSQELLEMTQVTKCIQTVFLMLVAAVIMAMEKEMFFSKNHLSRSLQRISPSKRVKNLLLGLDSILLKIKILKKTQSMKHILLPMLVIVLFITAPMTVYAQGPGNPDAGFSGRFQAGVFHLQTDSQLFADDDNRRNNDLDGPADTNHMTSGLASVNLRYQFESGTAIYAGNPLEAGEGFSVAAGISQPVGQSTLDVAATWLPIGEVWKDPYETAKDRDQSDADVHGLRVKFESIAGSPWEIEYRTDRIKIKDDEIGEKENDLKRNGWNHEVGVTYNIMLKPGLNLSPELGYIYNDIEGRSNSYQGLKLGAMLKQARPPWVFIGLVSGSHHRYQKTHPLFGKTRQESEITTFAQVIRLNLFGMKKLFASLGAGYVWSDANIDFFDSRTVIGLASVGINF